MRKPPSFGILFPAAVLLFPAIAFAAGEDPSIPLLLYLVVILVTAKLMGHLAVVLGQPAAITLKAVGFLAGSPLVGTWITPRLFSGAAQLRGAGVLVGVSLAFCFLMVIVTTLVAPPLLKWSLSDRKAVTPPEGGA